MQMEGLRKFTLNSTLQWFQWQFSHLPFKIPIHAGLSAIRYGFVICVGILISSTDHSSKPIRVPRYLPPKNENWCQKNCFKILLNLCMKSLEVLKKKPSQKLAWICPWWKWIEILHHWLITIGYLLLILIFNIIRKTIPTYIRFALYYRTTQWYSLFYCCEIKYKVAWY